MHDNDLGSSHVNGGTVLVDEQARIASLVRMLPGGGRALEIGARGGYMTQRLTECCDAVVALDLVQPQLAIPRVSCVAGDVRSLSSSLGEFDVVICTEVLEHVPSADLDAACNSLARVTRRHLLIGVPFRQDLRVARTRCASCGSINPPWGHVNRFDEAKLQALFTGFHVAAIDRVGSTGERTNWLSHGLMRMAGYPWGTYTQDEPCINCGGRVGPPPRLTHARRVLTAAAFILDRLVRDWRAPQAKWLHVLFEKNSERAG